MANLSQCLSLGSVYDVMINTRCVSRECDCGVPSSHRRSPLRWVTLNPPYSGNTSSPNLAYGAPAMDLNYFVCTLGQAARRENKPKLFTNINDFIERQAQTYASLPAVGFYTPNEDSSLTWDTHILTFQDVFQGICVFTERLSPEIDTPGKQTVALLCPSSAKFLFTWLAVMRLGHPVLLIAPQCSPSAIAQLCKQSDCSVILYDDSYDKLANAASQASADVGREFNVVRLPFKDEEVLSIIKEQSKQSPSAENVVSSDVAYLHHTSGTSSGIPKPIPQTHHAGAGVYANFEGSDQATFTTTPLYHGGIADLFRAWTSHSLIWLFPGKEAPITSANVINCLRASEDNSSPPVDFFSSVPYVLEMLAEDPKGIEQLQKMAIVGVGGAALPTSVGDKLVTQNVNLVSRYGSAECGFLMSSNRDFARDREWQYLRQDPAEERLRFEEREDGLSELIVLSGWPHMSKTNREDGAFATSDLLQPHPTIEGAWKYHSRADSQLTLITGKKFDPSPLESALTASSHSLQDVLVFGNGKAYPGALLFRSQTAKDMSDEELLHTVAGFVEKLNEDSQSHAKIAKSMLVPMPWTEMPLEKSSKGTILRGKAEERYTSEIEKSYGQDSGSGEDVSDEAVPDRVLQIVGSVLSSSTNEPLGSETDLFALGVDSIACVRIRHAVHKLLPGDSEPLPMTIVQDCGTVAKLSQVLLSIRQGKAMGLEKEDDVEQSMIDLVEQYGQFQPASKFEKTEHPLPNSPDQEKKRTIILTGPTGSLGSHLLHCLLQLDNIHIHLLLRGSSVQAAKERVHKALSNRRLSIPSDLDAKVTIHPIALAKPHLGLSSDTWDHLAATTDVIFHLAWSVDFLMPLKGFRQHFAGLQSLLELAMARSRQPAHFIFCSSTASTSASRLPEHIVEDPHASGTIGYSRSKWVAENICLSASRTNSNLRIDVVRAGQLSGDSVHGIWNASEGYPLMLSSARIVGCLPDLADEDMRWVPVDVAAQAFVDLLHSHAAGLNVCHIINPNTATTWRQFCSWIQPKTKVGLVPVKEWLERLGDRAGKGTGHACLKLLEFWNEAYGESDHTLGSHCEKSPQKVEYELTKTFELMPTVASMKSTDEDYALRLWAWIEENVGKS